MLRIAALLILVWSVPVSAQLCEHEDVLGELATSLGLAGELDADVVREALHESESDLPAVRVVRTTAAVRAIAADADAPLVCGRAEGRDGALWVVAPRGGSLQVDADGLQVGLHPDFRHAYVAFVGAAGGAGERGIRFQVQDGAHIAWPDLPLPITAQLIAEGPAGPRPVAERVRGGDLRESARLQSDASLETRVANLRDEIGAGPLPPHRLLREEAEAHARRICRAGRASHHDAEGRNPEERLRERRGVARVVGETVARAQDDEQASAALLESPSHRLTIVDRRFTDVGVGIAEHRGHTCVVLEFAAWPRYQ